MMVDIKPGRKTRKRVSNAKQRARRKGVKCERIDPIEVGNRFGWRCYICGCATPYALRGKIHGDAPTMDHIVPLAEGGEHTKENVANACRWCNLHKSDLRLNDRYIDRARRMWLYVNISDLKKDPKK